jgi:hypothetical protein
MIKISEGDQCVMRGGYVGGLVTSTPFIPDPLAVRHVVHITVTSLPDIHITTVGRYELFSMRHIDGRPVRSSGSPRKH